VLSRFLAGDWAPWIPFPFRISLTYGTERHTEAEIKKRLGFPTLVFWFLPRVPSLGCSLTTIKRKHWDGYRWATYVLCWTWLTFHLRTLLEPLEQFLQRLNLNSKLTLLRFFPSPFSPVWLTWLIRLTGLSLDWTSQLPLIKALFHGAHRPKQLWLRVKGKPLKDEQSELSCPCFTHLTRSLLLYFAGLTKETRNLHRRTTIRSTGLRPTDCYQAGEKVAPDGRVYCFLA